MGGYLQCLHYLQMGLLCLLVESKKKKGKTKQTLILKKKKKIFCIWLFFTSLSSFQYASPNQSTVLCASGLAKYDTTNSAQPYSTINYPWTQLPYISGSNRINFMAAYNNLLFVFGAVSGFLGSYTTSYSIKIDFFFCMNKLNNFEQFRWSL